MVGRVCFVFVVFYLVAMMVVVVSLRDINTHLFYRLYANRADEGQLKQELWQKQLRLEGMISPDALMRRLDAVKPMGLGR